MNVTHPRVMVVEDEPLLRMMLADQLSEDAFVVVEAENADVALTKLRSGGAELNAVITDVRMPGSIDGLELARQILARWPHLKVFITSGHCQVNDPGIPPGATFVPKPYFTSEFTSLLSIAFESSNEDRRSEAAGFAVNPGADAESAMTLPLEGDQEGAGQQPARLLIVEDDDRDLELTLSALQHIKSSFEVDVARDGSEALEYVARRGNFGFRRDAPPSAILLDLKLPKLGGLEVISVLKADPTTCSIPVVVLTGSNEKSDRAAADELGATGYIVKPLGLAHLIDALRKFEPVFSGAATRQVH